MGMKYLGAYLMAVVGGKENPTPDDIKAILEAGGIAFEEEMIARVCEKMDGKQAHELIAAGYGKFAACGGGGGGGGGGQTPATGGGGGDTGGAAKKEEAKVEVEEEEEAMDFDLFG
mmetsp:Transcript_106064/g.167511  ORF Transcript_106064/g.167511 Transcript_106064/m.167511 type:complete len:116 (-) Transcript_106064:39-386(-)|eukprot:CAMPEP_0169084772 /NCGR_PEP_ID=MMETSP1015-20121227/12804_1 /TAXON_ID=342587 /ORGANISM="Karlodinium micrum, Strain CCMP2283" /LENGTH=115 /DNA_ID=CAMNT_0009144813 /DNA_START=73 /DNA_END=420 /DNA_ORIENTATION=-